MIDMAVSLPTAADVRKIREQAAKGASERAEVARTPLLAVLGAGDLAYTTAVKAITDARARASQRAEQASHLPGKLTAEELRKVVEQLREQARKVYAGFAERGEQAWGKFRENPQVKEAVTRFGGYADKFDARVDTFVDDAHDAAEKALTAVSRQTRSTGEKAAQATKRFSGKAAESVTEASEDVSEAVADTGAKTAEVITEAGDGAATTTRSTTRKAASRTRPAANSKPAATE
jgi:heparin binding hemagglutinin HbhA